MPSLSNNVVIIIPTYNEKGNVDRLIPVLFEKIFPKVPPEFQMHVLIVDDSSPDGTGKEVEKLSKKYPTLHLFTNKRKAGLGHAYMKGMKYALDKLKADIVFEMDADFSHDPTKIKPMLLAVQKGADMVLGSRYIQGGGIPDNWGLHRKFLSRVGNLVIQVVITDFSIRDWTGGFRAIKRKVVEAVLPDMSGTRFSGYTFQIGFLHKAVRKGFKITEIPFHFVDRTLGKSKLGAEYIKNTLLYIFRVRAGEIFRHRLFKFAAVGVVGAVVQLSTLQLFRYFFGYQVAYFLSVEMAVLSNFIWSNVWTFADRRLSWPQIPVKFLHFNLASAGSILIQQVLAWIVDNYIGIYPLFKVPFIGLLVDTGLFFAIVGIFLGMFWNFFAYTKLIWRKK